MSTSESRELTKVVGLRLAPAEYRKFKEEADEAGIHVPTLIRQRLGMPA